MPEQPNTNQFTQEEVINFIKNLYFNNTDFVPSDYMTDSKRASPEEKAEYDNAFWEAFNERNSFLEDAMNEGEARNLIVQELKKDKDRFDPEFRAFKDYYRKQHGDDSITDNVDPFSPGLLRDRPTDVDHLSLSQVNKLCNIIAARRGSNPDVPTDEEGEEMSSREKLFHAYETKLTTKERENWGAKQANSLLRDLDSQKEFDDFKRELGLSPNTTRKELWEYVKKLLTRGVTAYMNRGTDIRDFVAPQIKAKYREGKKPDKLDIAADLAVLGLAAVPGGALASKGMMPLAFGKLAGYGKYGGKLAELGKPALGAGILSAMNEGVDYAHDVAEDFTDEGRYSRSQTRRPVKNPFKKELNPLERASNVFSGAASGAVTGGLINIGAGSLGWAARNKLRKMAEELDPKTFKEEAQKYKESLRKAGEFDFDKNNTKKAAEEAWGKYYYTEKSLERIREKKKKLLKEMKESNTLRRKGTKEKERSRKLKEQLKLWDAKEEAAKITLEGMEDTLGRRYGAPLQRGIVRYIKNHPYQKEFADWLLRAAKFRNFDPNTSYTLGSLYKDIGKFIARALSDDEDEDE